MFWVHSFIITMFKNKNLLRKLTMKTETKIFDYLNFKMEGKCK